MSIDEVKEEPKIMKLHICCKADQNGQCELLTVTASQISSFILFFAYIIYDIVQTFISDSPNFADSKVPIDNSDIIINIQMVFISLMTLFYYFIGCWIAEEDYIDELRGMKKIYFYAQWIIRILAIGIFGFYATAKHWLHEWFDVEKNYQLTILYCCTVFASFVFWDLIVLAGGKNKIVNKFLWYDCSGCGLLIVLYKLLSSSYHYKLIISGLLLLLLIILSFVMLHNLSKFKAFSVFGRIFSKSKIR